MYGQKNISVVCLLHVYFHDFHDFLTVIILVYSVYIFFYWENLNVEPVDGGLRLKERVSIKHLKLTKYFFGFKNHVCICYITPAFLPYFGNNNNNFPFIPQMHLTYQIRCITGFIITWAIKRVSYVKDPTLPEHLRSSRFINDLRDV